MAGPPHRPRELLYCPRCGHDLDEARPRRIGNLYADPMGETFWKGERVRLSATQRIILASLLTARAYRSRRDRDPGHFATPLVIAERAELSVDAVPVELTRIRAAFRTIDPAFNHIEAAGGGGGWRWSEAAVKSVLARSPGGQLVIYDNGETLWRNRFRIFLSAQESRALAMLVRARGRAVAAEEISRATSTGTRRMAYAVVERIRRKFGEADRAVPIIATQSGQGFCLAPGTCSERVGAQKSESEAPPAPLGEI